jgi:pentatricopeptide repeat protein
LEKYSKYYEDTNGFFDVYYGEAYCKIGNIKKANEYFQSLEKKLENLIEKKVFFDESHFRNIFKCFIHYYCEKNDLNSVLVWKKKIVDKNLGDISIFNIILEYLFNHKEKEKFIDVFKEMYSLDIIPDDNSFHFLFSLIEDSDSSLFYQSFHSFIICGTSVGVNVDHPLSVSLLRHLNNPLFNSIIFQLLKSCKYDHPINVSDIEELVKEIIFRKNENK